MEPRDTAIIKYSVLGILGFAGIALLFVWPPSIVLLLLAILIGSGLLSTLFSFSGRVGRSVYWLSTIATAALYLAFVTWQATLNPWDQVQVYTTYAGDTRFSFEPSSDAKLVYWLFGLAAVLLLLIGLSVSARRWHDHDKSAWMSLIGIIPIFGSLYVFVMLAFLPGTDGPNRYGDKPGTRAISPVVASR